MRVRFHLIYKFIWLLPNLPTAHYKWPGCYICLLVDSTKRERWVWRRIELYMHGNWAPPKGLILESSLSSINTSMLLQSILQLLSQSRWHHPSETISKSLNWWLEFSTGSCIKISIVPFDWHLDALLYWLPRVASTVFCANRAKLTCCSLVRPSNQRYTGPH